MKSFYPTTTPSVKPRKLTFKQRLNALFDWIRYLARARGYCWAENASLAEKFDCTERTITTYIAILIRQGRIAAQRVGNGRHITILPEPAAPAKPPSPPASPNPRREPAQAAPAATPASPNPRPEPAQAAPAPLKESVAGSVPAPDFPPNFLPNTLTESLKKDNSASTELATKTEPVPEANVVFSILRSFGVYANVASRLVKDKLEVCKVQIEALKNKTGIKNKAAWLVAAIQGEFQHEKKKERPTAIVVTRTDRPPLPPAPEVQAAAAQAFCALEPDEQLRMVEEVTQKWHPSLKKNTFLVKMALMGRNPAPALRPTGSSPAIAAPRAAIAPPTDVPLLESG